MQERQSAGTHFFPVGLVAQQFGDLEELEVEEKEEGVRVEVDGLSEEAVGDACVEAVLQWQEKRQHALV